MDPSEYTIDHKWHSRDTEEVCRAEATLKKDGTLVAVVNFHFSHTAAQQIADQNPRWREDFGKSARRVVDQEARALVKDVDAHVDVVRTGDRVRIKFNRQYAGVPWEFDVFQVQSADACGQIQRLLAEIVVTDDVTAMYRASEGGAVEQPASKGRNDVLRFFAMRLADFKR